MSKLYKLTTVCDMRIDTLLDLPDSAIAGFVNEPDRKVYLLYSTSLMDALVRNVRQLKDGSHSCKELVVDRDKLEFKVIETISSDDVDLRLPYLNWTEELQRRGYSMYRNYTPIRLYAKMAYSKNLKQIEVRIYNKRYEWFVVGVFNTAKEADEWMRQTYPEGRVREIIYRK